MTQYWMTLFLLRPYMFTLIRSLYQQIKTQILDNQDARSKFYKNRPNFQRMVVGHKYKYCEYT
jgi:hypothetical protein